MIDRTLNTWNGAQIPTLFNEFAAFTAHNEIGPWILWLIESGLTANGGRSPFHVRKLRDRFYHELATDYVARIIQQERVSAT